MDQDFWAKLSDRLSQILGIEKFKYLNGGGFVDIFSRERTDKKKVVIIWDEFDRYTGQDQEIHRDLLTCIRALRDQLPYYPAFKASNIFYILFHVCILINFN